MYKLRNLPCNIMPSNQIWCVSGRITIDENNYGGGVLEWCYDKEDAEYILEKMEKDSRYSKLRAHKYKP